MKKVWIPGLLLFFFFSLAQAQRLQLSDFTYKGAFRLPDASGGSSWEYSGYAMTFYPDGDPSGPNDGYPGSIFAIGHDHQQYVSEISIPVPVISPSKSRSELNTATTLQGFADITGNMFGELEIPRAGLAYLPAQGSQTTDKLHFCWGQHFQNFEASHGWSELTLSSPQSAGPWHFGGYSSYVTNDILFDIPQTWAQTNTPGQMLVSGRFRDGPWSGYGPALFAYGPWNDGNPPAASSTLTRITPLLLYGTQTDGEIEITLSDSMKMTGYKEPDEWSGGAWLTAGAKSAVLLVGTKATGNAWYGFSNGVVYPTDPDAAEYPDVPPWPHDDRGWWSESVNGQFMLFDTDQLAAVAKGTMQPYDPQPYTTMNVDSFLYDPGFDLERGKRYLLGGACFDRTNGILYVMERMADEDEKSLVHVWSLAPETGNDDVSISGMTLSPVSSPAADVPFTVTVNASSRSGKTLYYKFFYCANYGTDAYAETSWTTVQDYTTSNTAPYRFSQTGSYVIVARVVTDPSNEPEAVPIIGQAVTITEASAPVFISSLSLNTAVTPSTTVPVSFTASASTASEDTIYYQFWYCANYGTSAYSTSPWTMVQDYSTAATCAITFPSPNNYVVVVRAVKDPRNEPLALPIIGGTIKIE